MNIHKIASGLYNLWFSLPSNFQDIEPFRVLSFPDDPLSWGDEKQTREIYEGLFEYYKEELSCID